MGSGRINDVSTPTQRLRGVAIVKFNNKLQKYILQRWPSHGPPMTQKRAYSIYNFKQAVALIKRPAALDAIAAYQWSSGTPFLPRDLLMKAAYGTLYEWTDSNGQVWKGVTVLQSDIQTLLASLGNANGSLLLNYNGEWMVLLPGSDEDVLTMDGASGVPLWKAPSGGGSGGGLTKIGDYAPDAATNTYIDFPLDVSYDRYKIVVQGPIGPSDCYLGLQVSDNAGASFYTGTADYKDQNSNSNKWMNIVNGTQAGNGRPFLVETTFMRNPGGGYFIHAGSMYGVQSSGAHFNAQIGGCQNSTLIGVTDYARVAADTAGALAGMKVSLYAII